MRIRIPVLCAATLAVSCTLSAQAVELRGFRGHAWGTDVDSLGETRQVSAEGGVQCYRRERENLLYGDSELNEVRWCFHDAHLFLVVIASKVDTPTLAAEFEGTYGKPAQRTASMAAWGDARSRARVEISGTPATLRIWSTEHMPGAANVDVAHRP